MTTTIVKDGIKQDDWDELRDEVLDAVGTFHVLENDAY